MNEQETIAELKRQLEEANARNQQLEQEMKYKDKLTGLWNRKYAEKILEENEAGSLKSGFTTVCLDVDNLNLVNEKSGPDAGDGLLKKLAEGLQQSFGEKAICCKMIGTKMCVFLTATREELDQKIGNLEQLINSVKESTPEIDISYGFARYEVEPEKDASALMKEAEYALLMHKVSKENDENTPAVPRKQRAAGEAATILMIDDSLVILRTLQMMLKDEYKVLMATSGMEGYEIAKAKTPDLILLDYKMPVVDGEKIMQLLKQSNLTKNIPVIFVSGVSDKQKIMRVASLKPAGYLLKPVEKDNLLHVIGAALQS